MSEDDARPRAEVLAQGSNVVDDESCEAMERDAAAKVAGEAAMATFRAAMAAEFGVPSRASLAMA